MISILINKQTEKYMQKAERKILKKHWIIAFFLIFFLHPCTYASQDDMPLTASVTVDTVFNLEVDRTLIDFGKVEPGSVSPEETFLINCETNLVMSWKVTMTVNPALSEAGGKFKIPNSNFTWKAELIEGQGLAVPSGAMSETPVDLYAYETNNMDTTDPVKLSVSLLVDVPRTQAAGKYSTILLVTMLPEQ